MKNRNIDLYLLVKKRKRKKTFLEIFVELHLRKKHDVRKKISFVK